MAAKRNNKPLAVMSLENISIASCHVFIPQLTQSLDVFSSTDECRLVSVAVTTALLISSPLVLYYSQFIFIHSSSISLSVSLSILVMNSSELFLWSFHLFFRTDETTPRSYNRDVASRFVRPEYTVQICIVYEYRRG